MSRILSVHEVYFLVRTGTWSEDQLNQWLQLNLDAHYDDTANYEEYTDISDHGWDDEL